MEKIICRGGSGGLSQLFEKLGGRSPALFAAQRRTQGLPHQAEGAAFVPEEVSPPAGPGCSTLRVAAEGYGTGPGDGDDAGLAAGSSSERDGSVAGEDQVFRGDDSFNNGALAGRPAAEAQAG